MVRFIDEFDYDTRLQEAKKVKAKYPERVCIIVERSKYCPRHIPVLDKRKYMVSNNMTVSGFLHVIRKRLTLAPEEALLFFINDAHMISGNTLISQVYKEYASEDEFLYINYSGENTFG